MDDESTDDVLEQAGVLSGSDFVAASCPDPDCKDPGSRECWESH
jgi:hypothetical protein